MRRPRRTALPALALALAFTAAPTLGAEPEGHGDRALEQRMERLERELRELRAQLGSGEHQASAPDEEDELKALREAALTEAEADSTDTQTAEAATEEHESTVFRSGQLALQALNPEISVVGDFLGRMVISEGQTYAQHGDEVERSGFEMRTFGVHLESYLDPFSRMKAAIGYHDGRFSLGEAYITFFDVLPGLNVTAGKFRQQLGVVNRWHLHGLDQVNYPLPLKRIFGPGGLNQTGLSLEESLPSLGPVAQALTLQITNGDNGRVFQGEEWSCPVGLLRHRSFMDVTKDTYVELGLTGMAGPNSHKGVISGGETHNEDWRMSYVLGADLSLLWEPTSAMRYRNILWRTELYSVWKEVLPGGGRDETFIHAWGIYSYLQAKLTRTIDVGVRGDLYLPDHRSFSMGDLASDQFSYQWQVVPYLTWSVSPFVHIRFEYNHLDGARLGDVPREDRFYVQLVFAAGPHKHERY